MVLLNKRKLVLVTIALLLICGAILFWRTGRSSTPATNIPNPPSPPTQEERQQAEANKDEIVDRNMRVENTPQDQSQPKQVNITITQADATIVRAYINGVFEENGTCTATATKNTQTITKSSQGFGNVSYTQCAPMQWDTPLTPGTWNIKVTYQSSTAKGEQPRTVKVE